ncbi:MAG: addiction module protein [Burkholderiales bacterium]
MLAEKETAGYNGRMGTRFKELERRARALSAKEKAALARVLIEGLDPSTDPNAEQLWIEEAQRRYDAFVAGKLQAQPGEEVMRRARRRLN